jgi:hypothetical protein
VRKKAPEVDAVPRRESLSEKSVGALDKDLDLPAEDEDEFFVVVRDEPDVPVGYRLNLNLEWLKSLAGKPIGQQPQQVMVIDDRAMGAADQTNRSRLLTVDVGSTSDLVSRRFCVRDQ